MINPCCKIVLEALNQLEVFLCVFGLWSDARPLHKLVASLQPFCYATLEFEKWLQFIFIGRLREIIQQNDRIPESCCVPIITNG